MSPQMFDLMVFTEMLEKYFNITDGERILRAFTFYKAATDNFDMTLEDITWAKNELGIEQ